MATQIGHPIFHLGFLGFQKNYRLQVYSPVFARVARAFYPLAMKVKAVTDLAEEKLKEATRPVLRPVYAALNQRFGMNPFRRFGERARGMAASWRVGPRYFPAAAAVHH